MISLRSTVVLTATALLAAGAFAGCSQCVATTIPCGHPTTVSFTSECGFTSFDTTCSNVSADHVIAPTANETCDVTFVLGDGTTHHAHVVFTQQQPAPCDCQSGSRIEATVDGFGPHAGQIAFGAHESRGPSTCAADAGAPADDASIPDASDASAIDATGQ